MSYSLHKLIFTREMAFMGEINKISLESRKRIDLTNSISIFRQFLPRIELKNGTLFSKTQLAENR